jgi:ribosome recycling factor
MDPVINKTRSQMQKAFDVLYQDFATVHAGKASPTLVENVQISAYGGEQKFKLLELATISATDPKTITITPFDQSIISDIQKGIMEANLGFNPVVSSNILRINIPPLTEERRKELVKAISQKAENGRIMIRQIRHEAMEEVKGMEEDVSEDEVKRLEKEIQKLTDEFMGKIDTLRDDKEVELLRI